MPSDFERVRNDFPLLAMQAHGKPLAYLDNAATSQKPLSVIAAVDRFYREQNANIHRGVYELSDRATRAYEGARSRVRQYLNAREDREIVFVRGATEAINLVARSYGAPHLKAGDEVLLSHMEHHANIVPWQLICAETGATIRVIPVTDEGAIDLDAYQKLLSPRTKMVGITHASNTLGTINPIAKMVAMAHGVGAKVLVDGAQAIAHLPVDVQALDCDFYVFSGHKVFAPTGIGALYARRALLDAMPPYQGGGDMIRSVSFEKTTYADAPQRFEAGTPNIAGAVGLGAAFDYLKSIDFTGARAYEDSLCLYATERLRTIPGIRIIGTAPEKVSVVSFVSENVHPHDLGTFIDQEGIAVRTGQHCTEPLMERFRIPATVRASFAFYNTRGEIDRLIAAIEKAQEFFG